MKNKAVKIGIIASLLPHLFCCVLPIVLSILSLFAPEVAHTHFIPEWIEPWLFVFSALMLGVSWILIFQECPCSERDKKHNHKTQKIILCVVTCLFILSVVLHILAH
ncbi:MAG: hypothetical protein MJ156_02175 [Alphaproteobacteria bacterium]|nr:hypothetical protein [Alphaproteobacteria bacterium]